MDGDDKDGKDDDDEDDDDGGNNDEGTARSIADSSSRARALTMNYLEANERIHYINNART